MRNTDVSPFLESASESYTPLMLENYLSEVDQSIDQMQVALFTRHPEQHIGNIKFTFISISRGSCEVGFLIGEKRYRGGGLAGEAFWALSAELNRELGISYYELGVDRQNVSAIRAYEKMGFRISGEETSTHIRMSLKLSRI